MPIRDRVARLVAQLPRVPQYPTQGVTLFVDLERRDVQRGYTPLPVIRTVLAGRGANMFYLYRLVDETLDPLDSDIPLIFGSGVLTGIVPSAARGNATSWSPESRVILDSNAGDYFPSFIRMNGIDHLVLFGRSDAWTVIRIREGQLEFVDARPYLGLDNIDLRERIPADFGGTWTRDLAMVNVTRAGENLVLTSAIMAGPKACYARGGPGAKMGSLKVKAIVVQGQTRDFDTAQPYKGYNRTIAQKLLDTSVVKHALKTMGTPFLYKPSRILGAMGTKNNQETTWTDRLDAEHITPYRPGMAGCFRCPVNCRPLNALNDDARDKYGRGDGPEYVTLGKFGPNLGIDRVEAVIRLNNICNDLGLDTASTGSSIAWAMELYQRGIINRTTTGGLDLAWGNAEAVEQLLFLIARREAFGDVVADGARAVDTGRYPREALKYRMAVKGPDAERSPRCADSESVRARSRRGYSRDGSPSQPRDARDQRAHQRRSRFQNAVIWRTGQRRAEQLRGQGSRGACLRKHVRGWRRRRHVPLHDEIVQQSVASWSRGICGTDRQRHRSGNDR